VCNEITKLLKSTNFVATVLFDDENSLYIGYSIKIGEDIFESQSIGKTFKKLNFVSLIMILCGVVMLIVNLKNKSGSLYQSNSLMQKKA
jgi:hypothetical protein